jgi:hypothetical protein
MKPLLILLAAGSILTASAQGTKKESSPDTTKLRIGNSRIIIIDDKDKPVNDSGYKNVFGRKDSLKKHKKDREAKVHWAGLELGFNGFMTSPGNETMPKGYEFLQLNTGRIGTVNLNLFEVTVPIYKSYISLVSGMGLEWNNYYFRKDITLIPGIDSVAATLDNVNYSKNKLTTNFVTLPLFIEFNTHKKQKKSFHLGAGLVGGYLYRSHTKQLFEEAGTTYKRKIFENYNLATFRYSAMIRVGYGKFNIFANYALSGLFKDGTGPEIHPYSIGITVIGF